jgi:adenine-specific DNA-methyltransferase
MFGVVEGFDIVIGNPPYIKEYTNRKAFDGLRDSPYYQGKMDIWYFFACKGIDFLKDKGILTFIAQNNWVTNYGASKMRNKVVEECKILQLLDFGSYFIFGSSDIQTMIMIFQKNIRT